MVAWGVHLGRADRGGEKESPPSLVIYFLFFYFLYIFFNKQEYPDLFEYLTNLSGMCSPPLPHMLGYYKEKSHGSGSKMLTRGFEPRIS